MAPNKALVLLALLSAAVVATAQNPCSGKKDGVLVAAGACSATFYQCWQGSPVSPNPQCASPLVFNPKLNPQGCAYAGSVGTRCPCSQYYPPGDQRSACQVCRRRKRVGMFPLPGNPKGYVQCTTQEAVPSYCNGGLVWCPKKKSCDFKC